MHAQSRVLRAVPHANTHTVAHHRKGRNAPAVRAFSHFSRHARRMHNPQESTDDEGLPSAAAAAAPVRARASGLRSPVSGRAYGPTTSRARSTRQQPAAAFKPADSRVCCAATQFCNQILQCAAKLRGVACFNAELYNRGN